MEEEHQRQHSFVQSRLPWVIAAAAFVLYLTTLNRWVTIGSLPYVSKVAGWDFALPQQAPLFYLLTFPIRWLPAAWQPIALNLFSAACAAAALGLLARSVALLPHDRTHEQRQRERSEYSLLTFSWAWIPPVFAALVCGLQMSFWEHAIAATNESLDLLIFAYVIRCLLEFRIDQRESWLNRMALVYGLGITNNWALIGFFPGFLVALVWIRGLRFFEFAFITRMIGFGLAGMSLYLLLPLLWVIREGETVGFWEVLRAQLVTQKMMLFDIPGLRSRVLVLSLTSILPVFIIGIRWPSTFGDTSAAGAALTNVMFRVIHLVLLAACIYVAFDPQFSPRALGRGLAFLTFYYLGALSIGYFTGYVLLVFGEARSTKSWHRRSQGSLLLNRLMVWSVWVAVIAVPAALVLKNYPQIRLRDGSVLAQLTAASAQALPEQGALVLSDDPYALLMLEGYLGKSGEPHNHLLLYTHSLTNPKYHRQLVKKYPGRWPVQMAELPLDEVVDDGMLMQLMTLLARTNAVYYLHPSFGYYFERFYTEPDGLICKLSLFGTNQILSPPLDEQVLEANKTFWSRMQPSIEHVQAGLQVESGDAAYAAGFYSRALNFWGVLLQRHNQLEEAGRQFQLAHGLNSNNVPALVNLEFNRALRTGDSSKDQGPGRLEEKFGEYRTWERVLIPNGPFDHPDFCYQFGEILSARRLFRQAAAQFDRVQKLAPDDMRARLALVNVYIQGEVPDKALEELARIRSSSETASKLTPEDNINLARLEAAAYFASTNYAKAEELLLATHNKYPNSLEVLDTLVQFYTQIGQPTNALKRVDQLVALAPDRPEFLLTRANIQMGVQNFDDALRTVEQVLKKTPEHIQALLYRVFIHIQQKNYAAATSDLDRILKISPENVDARLYQGVVYLEKKEYAKAVRELDRVLERAPSNWNALRNRAIAHLHLENLDAAREDYETLRKLVPNYFVADYGLAEIAYRRKQKAEAIRNYELYLRHVPQDVDTPEMEAERNLVIQRLKELKGSQ